jgi:chemotaxis protein MotA
MAAEIATPVGIVLGFGAVIGSYIMEGGSPMVMIQIPALLLVFLGTMGICIASNRISDIGGVIKALMKALLPGKGTADGAATVTELMEFADLARREGLLSLEEKAKAVEDPFLKRGLELVVDGTDSEEIADTLEMEISGLRERHKVAQKFFADAGGFAPTLGIIGTVLGLVHALEGLSDPAKLGHAISAAFIATLWGVISANLMFLPIAGKLKRMSAVEIAHRELMVEGILAIQAGVSPRAVGERLKSHLAPATREGADGKKKDEKKAA